MRRALALLLFGAIAAVILALRPMPGTQPWPDGWAQLSASDGLLDGLIGAVGPLPRPHSLPGHSPLQEELAP